MKKVRALIAAELPNLVHRNEMARTARKERTLSGALRRAIHAFPRSPMTVAKRAGLEWVDLDDFLTGERTLPSDAIDRLVKVVKLKLPATSRRDAARAS
jgi:hypothetical protein